MANKKHREIEARWINLSPPDILKRLKEIGAQKIGDFFLKEWILQTPEWREAHRRVRVRTDGKTHHLTYKANASWAVDSTEEVDMVVSSADDAIQFINSIGIPLARYQEKKRQTFVLDNIVFDADTWPKVPFVLEIEAKSKKDVRRGAKLLGLSWKDAVFEDQFVMHKKYFGIDLGKTRSYRF